MVKLKKILIVLTIFILSLIIMSHIVLASDPVKTFGNYIGADTRSTSEVATIGRKILGAIRIVGTIIAVAMLMVLGIKYMLGSAEQKAEYKKTLFPYVVGAILIFGATNLADVIYNWAKKLGS